jgi:hypothetical protein
MTLLATGVANHIAANDKLSRSAEITSLQQVDWSANIAPIRRASHFWQILPVQRVAT